VVKEKAGFWLRFGAAVVDALVVALVTVVFRLAVGPNVGLLGALAVSALYFTYFHGTTGRTVGDTMVSIRVVGVEAIDPDSAPIGFGRALWRWCVSYVSFLFFFIGYLWMIWDPEKQTWQDKAARTYVVVV